MPGLQFDDFKNYNEIFQTVRHEKPGEEVWENCKTLFETMTDNVMDGSWVATLSLIKTRLNCFSEFTYNFLSELLCLWSKRLPTK